MGNEYLYIGLALAVGGIAFNTLRGPGSRRTAGRLMIFVGVLLVAGWMVIRLFPDLTR